MAPAGPRNRGLHRRSNLDPLWICCGKKRIRKFFCLLGPHIYSKIAMRDILANTADVDVASLPPLTHSIDPFAG